jgi:CubicO group peptidase (beta-lactamase class C family)
MRHDLRPLVLGAALLLAAAAPLPALASPADTAAARGAPAGQGRAVYYPGPGDRWERRTPTQAGMDSARLRQATEFAVASESKAPRDLALAHYQTFGREPFGEAVGAFRERGDPTGIVVRGGYIVAEWGDPHRVDMTFSVTKSFLSTVVGVAVDRGLIRSVDDRVAEYTGPVLALEEDARGDAPGRVGRSPFLEPFASPHNRTVT